PADAGWRARKRRVSLRWFDAGQHPRRPRDGNGLSVLGQDSRSRLELSPVASDRPADHDERLGDASTPVDPCRDLPEEREAARRLVDRERARAVERSPEKLRVNEPGIVADRLIG